MFRGRARWEALPDIERPGRISAGVLRAVRWVRPLARLAHRPTLAGLENLPEGPFLLVANHSAGLGISEILCFAVLYLREFADTRPLAGFALPTAFGVWPFSAIFLAIGAVPSTYAHATRALAKGVPLLVFPGGDHETLRPVWQHDRVDFGGRIGFLKIARDAGIPVVPMGIRGGAFTAPMLVRSRLFARLLVAPRLIGQKRWGLSLLGLLGALALAFTPLSWPWKMGLTALWLGSPITFMPWIPWTLRYRIGAPLAADTLFPAGAASDEAALREALARVENAVQSLVREPG
jgi:1-acyl-sn-glycerol-3-phosphate acyltransferase